MRFPGRGPSASILGVARPTDTGAERSGMLRSAFQIRGEPIEPADHFRLFHRVQRQREGA